MPPSMLFRSRTRGHDGPWEEPSPAFEGLDTTHGEGNVAFVEFSVLPRDTVFLSDEHSPPRAFPDSQPLSRLRCCSSIGDSPLSAQTSDMDVVQYSASLTPAHYQSDRTAPPGRPGLAWNAPRSRGRQQLGHLQRQHQRLVSLGSCLLSSSPSFFQGCKDARH